MKKVLSILLAIVMFSVIVPANAFALNFDTDMYITGVTLADANKDCYGGYRVTRASDPTGVYTASEGWKGEDENTKYYFVRHYVYLDKYGAYVADENFGEYGDLDILQSDFAASEYTFIGTSTTQNVEVQFYKEDELNGTSYYTEKRLKRASDPDAIYGCNTYTSSTNGEVTERGVMIHRFVIAPGTTKYIKDTTFAEIRLTDEQLAASEYSYMYEDVFNKEYLEWKGNVATGQFGNFVDGNGTHYAVDDEHNVYTIDGDSIEIGGTDYFFLTKTTAVTYSDLKPAVNDPAYCEHYYVGEYTTTPTCTSGGIIHWTCNKCGDEYYAPADAYGHNYVVTKTVAPTCTAQGYTIKTCTRCQATQKTAQKAALGHVKVIDKAVPATFKAAGKTQGAHCSRCKKVLTAQKVVAKLGAPKIGKLTPAKKKFTANWTPVKNVEGYELQYSLKSNFSGAKKVMIVGANAKSRAFGKLASKKTYYVRVRAYKKINGKMQYSAWSKSKVKTK